MRFGKVAFSAVMLGLGVYILLPTADELVIHPVLGLFFSYAFNIPFYEGVLISVVLYRVAGLLCLFSAIAVGGKPVYFKFKEKMQAKFPRKLR
jgi:hypothetical protein